MKHRDVYLEIYIHIGRTVKGIERERERERDSKGVREEKER